MKKVVLLAAGGTGGHIYPAVAVARELIHLNPEIDVQFVGTAHGLESQILPKEGFTLHAIRVGRLNRNVSTRERLLTLILMPWAFVQSLFLIFRLNPVFVMGVGGHASGPLLLMAALVGRKTFIWEPNAYPGLANRLLSHFVDESLVVFDEAKKILKTKKSTQVGLPVRSHIEKVKPRPSSEGGPLHVLVFGGSQGAKTLNTVVAQATALLNKKDFVFVHQTGAADFERCRSLYKTDLPVEVLPYLHDMDVRYAWADLVIARSGAGTVSELAACHKPSILVPLPTAADNHQQKNAEILVQVGAAMMILQGDLTPEALVSTLQKFRERPEMLKTLGDNISKFHKPQAAEQMAKYLLGKIDLS